MYPIVFSSYCVSVYDDFQSYVVKAQICFGPISEVALDPWNYLAAVNFKKTWWLMTVRDPSSN